MKPIIPAVLFLTLPFLMSAQEWKTYSTDSTLFTAKYPDTWVNRTKENKRVFFTSPLDNDKDDFRENINISVSFNPEFGTTTKITDLFPSVTDQLKSSIDEMTIEVQRNFKWNDTDAAELIYSGYYKDDNSVKIRITQWFCFYQQRLYVVTFTAAFDNALHNETAKKIMNSIKFK